MKVQLAYTIVAKEFEIAIPVAVWSNVIALAWLLQRLCHIVIVKVVVAALLICVCLYAHNEPSLHFYSVTPTR